MIHGTEDEVIDFSHGLTIYERCPRTVDPLWVEGAGHNDVELYGQYLDRLKQFINVELALNWLEAQAAETSMEAPDDADIGNGDDPSSYQQQQQNATASNLTPCPTTTSPTTTTLTQTATASEQLSSVEEPSAQASPTRLRLVDIACGGDKEKSEKKNQKEEEGDGDHSSIRLLKVVKTSAAGEPVLSMPGEERVVWPWVVCLDLY